MPNLIQSLQDRDIGHLRIVAGLWGIELAASDTDMAIKELAARLQDPNLFIEIIDSLPTDARVALKALIKAGGRLPWAAFVRRFGELREAGPGRRDREQIYLQPVSTAEVLFYRAFLARAFFDMPAGAKEFAYIPDDLIPLINRLENGEKEISMESGMKNEPLGRPASPKEREHQQIASDRLVDDATTLLAALRMGRVPAEMPIPVQVVSEFLSTALIITEEKPQIEPVRLFLEGSRTEALKKLINAWLASETFNELRQIPGLVCEGEWTNQPLVTREFLLNLLETIPENQWWSLQAFIHAIKEKYPDFQRPAGDYDSWFIKRESDSTFLRGFATWDEVDGALIRYIISGPLFWLGMIDLASPQDSELITAFRIVSNFGHHASDIRLSKFSENGKLHVSSQGKIVIPRLLPRATRYQIARFCEWDEVKLDDYCYHVTTSSLKKAVEQGLKVSQLLSLLAKNAASEIPPAFIKALKRWEINGTEARMEVQTILKVNRPEVLNELRKTKAGRFLGETLGPVTVAIKPGAQSKVLNALAELGLLAEEVHDEE